MQGKNEGLLRTIVQQAVQGGDAAWHAVARSLQSIAARDASVHAWTHVAALDQLRRDGGLDLSGSLAGVPFGVKDVIDVAGMPTSCGARIPVEGPERFDACCVAMLRMAGAVPVGKTVTAEYAFRHPGPTRNPWRSSHTPGGSSSGSAAAVAAGMVPLALGTQTGGSIIRPAAYCGVVGFKPSFGGVFRDGLKLTCESLDTIGWYAATVEDAAMAAEALLPYGRPTRAPERLPRVALVEGSPELALDAQAHAALMGAADTLRSHGVECAPAKGFTQAAQLAEIHRVVMTYEFARSLAGVVRCHADAVSPALRETVAQGLAIPDEVYLARRREQQRLRCQWRDMMGDADLVLTPSAPGLAPEGLGNTGSSAFNRIWTTLGWPCLHLPTALVQGLPVGVQLIADYEADAELLYWGAWIHEKIRGIPLRPA